MKSVSRRKYTEEFRAAAVEQVIVGRRGLREVARSLEMSDKTLANWVSDAREAPVKRGQRPPVTDLEAENSRLKQENARLRMEKEILKKQRRVCYENCLIDEGGPLDVVFQEKASNHFKLLRLRGVVVSVEEKGAGNASGRE